MFFFQLQEGCGQQGNRCSVGGQLVEQSNSVCVSFFCVRCEQQIGSTLIYTSLFVFSHHQSFSPLHQSALAIMFRELLSEMTYDNHLLPYADRNTHKSNLCVCALNHFYIQRETTHSHKTPPCTLNCI